MKFDEFAANSARAASALHLDPPAIDEVRAARRRRSAGSAVLGAFVGTLIIVGAAAWWPAGAPAGPPDTVVATSPLPPTTTAPPSTTSGPTATTAAIPSTTRVQTASTAPEFRVWSIVQPPSWHRADSELMPDLGWNSVTVATFPLRPGGVGCSHMPENALRDLGSTDVLISVFLGGAGADAAPWPANGFDDDVFPAADPNTDAHECAERPDLEVHWGRWETGGQGSYLLAVFGDAVPDETRREAWATLSSLSAIDSEGSGPMCVVTVPPEPGLVVPNTHPEEPVFGRWYGTSDLWTVLETDGSYGPRKSVWWSANFPGGVDEERPEVLVTWRRLDREAPILSNDSAATNAYTAEYGWFMIAGIDPEDPGCWEITATYKGATLSYVAAIR